jgi:hypothetical protein
MRIQIMHTYSDYAMPNQVIFGRGALIFGECCRKGTQEVIPEVNLAPAGIRWRSPFRHNCGTGEIVPAAMLRDGR